MGTERSMGVSGNIEKVLAAANEMEDMAAELKCMVVELRTQPENIARAYALAYEFRTRFGQKVIHKLGFGMPRFRIGKQS